MTRRTLETQLRELAGRYGQPEHALIEEGIERSAIREHLGNVSRDEADTLAYEDVKDRMRRA